MAAVALTMRNYKKNPWLRHRRQRQKGRNFMAHPNAENLENILIDALNYYAEEEAVRIKTRTYEDVGMLTTDRGLVVTLPDGSQFQVTIVQSK